VVVAEESVTVTQRDEEDKTPVMELLQRLSDSDAAETQQLPDLQLRMSRAHTC